MTPRERSAKRSGISYLILLGFIVGIAFFTIIALRPEILDFGSTQFTTEVVILPQEAADEGGQWRLVSQWQEPGEVSGRHLNFVEFSDLPGWVTPSPVVVGRKESKGLVQGQYIPVEYNQEVILTLAGSTTMAHRLVPELADHYLQSIGADEVRKLPGASADEIILQGIFFSAQKIMTIEIQGRGSLVGLVRLEEGSCDLAMSTFRPSARQEFGKKLRSPDLEYPVGWDAVALIVSRQNPVPSLTLEEVQQIFTGEINNWNQVQGPDAAINIFALDDSFGTRHVFEEVFMAGKAMMDGVHIVDAHALLPEFVAQDASAIGFSSLALANQCRELSIALNSQDQASAPTAANIVNKQYPGHRYLYFYLQPDLENNHAQNFIDFVQGVDGQALVQRFGFVPVVNPNLDFTPTQDLDPETKDSSADQNKTQDQGMISFTVNNTAEEDQNITSIEDKAAQVIQETKDLAAQDSQEAQKSQEIEPTKIMDDALSSKNDQQEASQVQEPKATPHKKSFSDQVFVRSQTRVKHDLSQSLPELIQPDGEQVPASLRRQVYGEYINGIKGAQHLSPVFRFRLGSVELDEESVESITHVVAFFNEDNNKDKTPIVVGFSDTAGGYAGNLAISRQRAQKVAAALKAQGIKNVIVLAAGEEDPAESNESRPGREKNRRVELWMQ